MTVRREATMNRLGYKDYFVHPVEPTQRRYEALRAVLVEERPMKEVAQRVGVSYGAVRNWVSAFCKTRDAGQSPPFSLGPCAVAPRWSDPRTRSRLKSPMLGRCRWNQDGGC